MSQSERPASRRAAYRLWHGKMVSPLQLAVRKAWFWYHPLDIAVHVGAKCGQTGVRNCFAKGGDRNSQDFSWLQPWQLDDEVTKVSIIRHPKARFESFWRDKVRDGGAGAEHCRAMTPDECIEFMERNLFENGHWYPQYKSIGHWRNVEMVRLEDWTAYWKDLTGRDYPKNINDNHKGTVPSYDVDRLLRLFATDLKIYQERWWDGKEESQEKGKD